MGLTECKRKSLPLPHPPSRSRLLLHQRESTPSGSEDPSLLPSPPSSRCGSPSRSTTSAAHPLSTASASQSTMNTWTIAKRRGLFFILFLFHYWKRHVEGCAFSALTSLSYTTNYISLFCLGFLFPNFHRVSALFY